MTSIGLMISIDCDVGVARRSGVEAGDVVVIRVNTTAETSVCDTAPTSSG